MGYVIFFFQAEDGIRDAQESRGLGDVYKRQVIACCAKNSRGSFKASWDHGLGGEGGVRAGHWFMSAPGIEEKARALGMMQTKDEIFPNFKARVYAAAGVTEAMVRAAKIDAGERV